MTKEDLLIRYFEGSLSPEEQELFNHLLASDTPFKTQVEEEELIRKAILLKERERLKARLKAIPGSSVKRMPFRWWQIAALFVGLVATAWWWSSSSDSAENIFQKHFRPYPNLIAPSVRSSNDTSLLYLAMLAYDRDQFEEAIPLLSRLYKRTENDTILLYQAISEMKTDKREAALLRLEAIRLNDSLYRPATWYAALGYLASDKKNKAISLLNQLRDMPGAFSDQADALLRDLR